MKASTTLTRLFIVAVMLPSGAGVTASPTAAPEPLQQNFTLAAGDTLEVKNKSGPILVRVWDKSFARLAAEKKAPAGEPVYHSELSVTSAQNKITIECAPTDPSTQIDLVIDVPAETHVQLTADAGLIQLDGAPRSLLATSQSGRIMVYLPPAQGAEVMLYSATGNIHTSLPITIYEHTTPHHLKGRIGVGRTLVTLRSESGDILLLPLAEDRAKGYTPSLGPDDPSASSRSSGQRPSGQGDVGQRSPAQSPDSIRISESREQNTDQGQSGIGPITRRDNRSQTGEGSMGASVTVIPPLGSARGTRPSDRTAPDATPSQVPSDDSSASSPSGGQRPPDQGDVRQRSPAQSPDSIRISESREQNTSQGRTMEPGPRWDNRSQTGQGSMGASVTVIPPLGSPRNTRPPDRTAPDATPSQAPPDWVPSPRQDTDSTTDPGSDIGTDSRRERTERGSRPPATRRGGRPPADKDDDFKEVGEILVLEGDLVSLNASVTDRLGNAIPGLAKSDFTVYENNVKQEIRFFSPVSTPFNLILMLDLSGSTREKIHMIKQAAINFLNVLNPEDRVAVVTFAQEVKLISPLTADRQVLQQRINVISQPSGRTALYEAYWYVLTNILRDLRGRRNALVVLTDGVDSSISQYFPTTSFITFEDIVEKIEEMDVTAYPIYLDTEPEVVGHLMESPKTYELARKQLKILAEVTGGIMFSAAAVSDLDQTYEQVAAELRTVYSLGYYPTNKSRDGRWRRVRLVVTRKGAVARTRRGYYAR